MKRRFAALFAALTLLATLCACGGREVPAETAGTVETPAETAAPTAAPAQEPDPSFLFTDVTGREIEFAGPVERVVALTPAECEILFALGAGETLVARGRYCDYPDEVKKVPSVGVGADVDLDAIIELLPDVVIVNTGALTAEQSAELQKAGIPIVVSEAQDVAGVCAAIRALGQLMGRESKAEELVAEMQAGFAAARETASGATGSVYFELSPLSDGLWTAGAGSFLDEIAGMLGLENAFGDRVGSVPVSAAEVIERDPDYILTLTGYITAAATAEEEIARRDGWDEVTAVENGAILSLSRDIFTRPGPRLAQAAQLLAEFAAAAAQTAE